MIGTKKKCAVCGKSLVFQGGKYVCMNEKCPEYLEGKSRSPLAEGLTRGGK